jgi:hypothetical protein
MVLGNSGWQTERKKKKLMAENFAGARVSFWLLFEGKALLLMYGVVVGNFMVSRCLSELL